MPQAIIPSIKPNHCIRCPGQLFSLSTCKARFTNDKEPHVPQKIISAPILQSPLPVIGPKIKTGEYNSPSERIANTGPHSNSSSIANKVRFNN